MNKRITSLLLCFVLIVSMLATAVPAFAAQTSYLKLTADKTEANPGDTITYTLTLGPVTNMCNFYTKLVVSDGLTVISGTVADGLQELMDTNEEPTFTLASLVFDTKDAGTLNNGYTSATETVLLTIVCRVNDGASGDQTVNLTKIQLFEQDDDMSDIEHDLRLATVKVTAPHTHVFDKEVATDGYLKTPASCTESAVYFKSCECGEKGTETFTSGAALGHDYSKKTETDTYLKTAASNCTENNEYWFACVRCNANAKDDASAADKYYTGAAVGSHDFSRRLEDDAHYVAGTGTDCLSAKQYYYGCAYCDAIGTETWESEVKGPHSYASVWSADKNNHWHECSKCHDKKDLAAHTPGAPATETEAQKCTECEHVLHEALGHTHSLTPVPAKAETCTEDGNTAYYVCSGCSKYFEDATANIEITDLSTTVLRKLGHDWNAATCTEPKTCKRDGCTATEGGPLGHSYASVWSTDENNHWHECSRCHDRKDLAAHIPGAPATETEAQKCTECGYVLHEALGHTHSLTPVPAKAATCTEDGNIEYYTCEGCNKLFADATANVELTASEAVVKATGHAYEWKIDKEATETEKGAKHEECKNCGDKKASVEIPEIGNASEPGSPKPAETPKSTETPKSPKTGDNMLLWVSLMLVSIGAVAGATLYSRKKKSVK